MTKSDQLYELKEKWAACERCPLSLLRKQVVFGTGNPEAKLVMIGEAPNEYEDANGELFLGKAGEAFDWILKDVGISRDDMWITNTVSCRPKSLSKLHSNRAPKLGEIRACHPRLVAELSIIKPEIIVLAGNTPLYMSTGMRGISKKRGWITKPGDDGPAGTKFTMGAYATLHPKSLLHGSKEQKLMKADWMKEDWLEIARVLLEEKRKETTKATKE